MPRTPRFTYSNEQLGRLIQAVQTKVSTLTEQKIFVGGEQALQWLSDFPVDILDKALEISSRWYPRKLSAGDNLSETDYVRYTSGVIRNLFETRQKFEDVRLAKLKAEWNAMSPKQQAEYPRGFDDFESLSGDQ